MGKAKKLYDEAKTLQIKAFKDIKAGRDIDIGPFRELASGFMDSVFRNQDALACLTQMRQKDAYLLEHSINVSILMGIFAKHLNIEKDIIVELTTGALLHDIGKIKTPDEVLNKPGRLTEAEFEIMKQHAVYSKQILEESGLTGIAVDIAGMHHERIDGTGYPFGKKGNEIVCVGGTGLHYSYDRGKTWVKMLEDNDLLTIRFINQNSAIATGKNRIIKLDFK